MLQPRDFLGLVAIFCLLLSDLMEAALLGNVPSLPIESNPAVFLPMIQSTSPPITQNPSNGSRSRQGSATIANTFPSSTNGGFECYQQSWDGVYADVFLDCRVFHICREGSKYSMTCPVNTRFHQGKGICIHESLVPCINIQQQHPNTNQQYNPDTNQQYSPDTNQQYPNTAYQQYDYQVQQKANQQPQQQPQQQQQQQEKSPEIAPYTLQHQAHAPTASTLLVRQSNGDAQMDRQYNSLGYSSNMYYSSPEVRWTSGNSVSGGTVMQPHAQQHIALKPYMQQQQQGTVKVQSYQKGGEEQMYDLYEDSAVKPDRYWHQQPSTLQQENDILSNSITTDYPVNDDYPTDTPMFYVWDYLNQLDQFATPEVPNNNDSDFFMEDDLDYPDDDNPPPASSSATTQVAAAAETEPTSATLFPEGDEFLDFESPTIDQEEFRELTGGPKSNDEVYGSPSRPVVFAIATQQGPMHFFIRNPDSADVTHDTVDYYKALAGIATTDDSSMVRLDTDHRQHAGVTVGMSNSGEEDDEEYEDSSTQGSAPFPAYERPPGAFLNSLPDSLSAASETLATVPAEEEEAEQTHVHIIHGTLEPGYPWGEPASARNAEEKFPPEHFWSGDHTDQGRGNEESKQEPQRRKQRSRRRFSPFFSRLFSKRSGQSTKERQPRRRMKSRDSPRKSRKTRREAPRALVAPGAHQHQQQQNPFGAAPRLPNSLIPLKISGIPLPYTRQRGYADRKHSSFTIPTQGHFLAEDPERVVVHENAERPFEEARAQFLEDKANSVFGAGGSDPFTILAPPDLANQKPLFWRQQG